MSSRERVLQALILLVVIALVVPFAAFAVPSLVGADRSYVVVSGSMEPEIGVGSIVFVSQVDPATVREGDVITYRTTPTADTVTTHRVAAVFEDDRGPFWFTKGDANEDLDALPVYAPQLVGEVTMTLPYVGYVVVFAQTTTGIMLLVIVPAVLLIVSELYDLAVAYRTGRDEAEETDAFVDATAPLLRDTSWPFEEGPITFADAPRTDGGTTPQTAADAGGERQ